MAGDGDSGGDATAARRDCSGSDEVMEQNNVVNDWKPRLGMSFDCEQAAYDFYNTYGGKVDFNMANANKNKHTKKTTSWTFVCYKEARC
ncbi:unnamed protein product [Camellia sinensis]